MIWMREISSVSSDWSEPRCLRAGALQREDSCRRSFGVREVWDGVRRLVRCRPNGRLPIIMMLRVSPRVALQPLPTRRRVDFADFLFAEVHVRPQWKGLVLPKFSLTPS